MRSIPCSQYAPEYNKEELKLQCQKVNIRYRHYGSQLGAMAKDPKLSPNGIVDFELYSEYPDFQCGIRSILTGIENGSTIVLLCAEDNPIECHRGVLIAKALAAKWIEVIHIIGDNTITPKEFETNLLNRYLPDWDQHGLFEIYNSHEEKLEAAYKNANKAIGYSPSK